jgi:hypothetical protein
MFGNKDATHKSYSYQQVNKQFQPAGAPPPCYRITEAVHGRQVSTQLSSNRLGGQTKENPDYDNISDAFDNHVVSSER